MRGCDEEKGRERERMVVNEKEGKENGECFRKGEGGSTFCECFAMIAASFSAWGRFHANPTT